MTIKSILRLLLIILTILIATVVVDILLLKLLWVVIDGTFFMLLWYPLLLLAPMFVQSFIMMKIFKLNNKKTVVAITFIATIIIQFVMYRFFLLHLLAIV